MIRHAKHRRNYCKIPPAERVLARDRRHAFAA
nr:MAG TPA: hypothetical protein [Caudoviricetes sp.]